MMEGGKLEFLPLKSRKTPVAIETNDSFTLSFNLPEEIVRQLNAETTEKEETLESWEDFDISTVAPVEKEQDNGDWQQDISELPDYFPVLLVNLTQLGKKHFAWEGEIDQKKVDELFQSFQQSIKVNFTQILEPLFEEKLCFNCTNSQVEAFLKDLEKMYPNDQFGVANYPIKIEGIELHVYLDQIYGETQWEAVNYIKKALQQTSRDLLWKAEIAQEMEKLAETEYLEQEIRRNQKSTEIDQLAEVRESLYLRALDDETSQEEKKKILGEVEEIESLLQREIDIFLKDGETADDKEIDLELSNGLTSNNMNVLDMTVAMIFERLPMKPGSSPEDHFLSLATNHSHIRKLWKKEFGRLPPRSNYLEEIAADSVSVVPNIVNDDSPTDDSSLPTKVVKKKISNIDDDNFGAGYAGDFEDKVNESRSKSNCKLKKKKKQKAFQPFACVSAFSALQMSNDDDF